jgi:hypothetical protein
VGKRRKEEMGSLGKEACEQRGPKGKERGGVRYKDEGENREPTRVLGTEGCIVRHNEASAAQCHGHARAAHMGPTIDGIHRARSDSDPACVALSNRS